ncbi:hypothetical protein BHE74_00048593 [Ensete ventricosum]|nr:hypothetical protein GW17_00027037 [Ensete ventricosum]RWW45558.1 hypothetical protein BHE74_00048593 [Ensete ventricosum]
MTVASSYLSEPRVSLATAAIVIQTTSLMDTLPTMLSTSVSARVGNELGADGRRSGHGPHRWLVHQLIVEQGVHRRRGGPPAHEGRAAGDRAIRARKRPADDGARCARQPVRLLPGGSAGGAGAGLLVRFGLSGLSLGLLTGQVARALSMVYMDWEGEAMMYAAFFLFKFAPLFPPPQKMKIRNERSRGGSSERMAGLSVLLETQESFPKYTHILSKTSLKIYASSTSSCSTHRSTFLEDCYLCRRRLQHGKDIYMYRSGTKDKFLSSTVQFVPGVFRNGVHSGNRNTVSLTLRGYYLADFCVNITAEETEPSVAKSAGDGRYLWTRRAGRGTTAPWPRRRAGSTRWGAAAGGRPSGDGCLPVVLLIRSCSLQEENDSSVIVFIYNYT